LMYEAAAPRISDKFAHGGEKRSLTVTEERPSKPLDYYRIIVAGAIIDGRAGPCRPSITIGPHAAPWEPFRHSRPFASVALAIGAQPAATPRRPGRRRIPCRGGMSPSRSCSAPLHSNGAARCRTVEVVTHWHDGSAAGAEQSVLTFRHSTVPAQMWQWRARSRCRYGTGEPTPGADVGSGEPSARADRSMWHDSRSLPEKPRSPK
jgi:hypothetical protein